jgi:hypothetical protein
MKNSFLLLFTAFTITVAAQSSIQLSDITNTANPVPVAHNSIIYLTSSFGSTKKISFDITNTSTSTITYNVKRYDIKLNSTPDDTAIAYFCFGGLCYTAETKVSPNPVTLGPGKSASDTAASSYNLIAYLDDASKKGCSEIRYTIFNTANTSDSAQVTVNYNCAAPAAISDFRSEQLTFGIFPNPAKNLAMLRLDSKENARVRILVYNSLGQMVIQKDVMLETGNNSAGLDISTLPSGIYIVNVKKGDLVQTRKLIIN